MAAPTRAELDAMLATVLAVGGPHSLEIKATALLCFGYVDAVGASRVVYMDGKRDGAAVIANKCEAAIAFAKPSRLVPRGFYARERAGRGVVAHGLNLLRFWAGATAATWALLPVVLALRAAAACLPPCKRPCTAAFFALLNCYFALARGRTFCLGFQGGAPIFDESGAVVAAFAASGALGSQDEACLAAGLEAAGLARVDGDDGALRGFAWKAAPSK